MHEIHYWFCRAEWEFASFLGLKGREVFSAVLVASIVTTTVLVFASWIKKP